MEWKYTEERPLRVFEAFAGYGSQSMALRNIGIPYEIVGYSEIDPYAIRAYRAVHGDIKNYGDITKIDWNDVPDFDLLTWSSPCQDFSNAGKQAGGEEGSGTRSSLLWEVKKCLAIKRPKYSLTENVRALVSQKFLPGFLKYVEYMNSLGYTTFQQILNAKDYGIPQNRERIFVVSVLGDAWFNFPQPFPLKLRLKDMLEEKVDEKYYLPQDKVDQFIEQLDDEKKAIIANMNRVTDVIMKRTKNMSVFNPEDSYTIALAERQMRANNDLRSMLYDSDTKGEWSGWKVKIDFEAKDGHNLDYRAERWFFLDNEGNVIFKTMEFPLP